MTEKNSDKQKNSYWSFENIIKTITTLVAVLGFGYGIFQFFAQQERQYRQKVYEDQLELYKEVVDLSSKIATAHLDSIRTNSFMEISRKFDQLFYGKMILFEDSAVEHAMINFQQTKQNYIGEVRGIQQKDVQESCVNLGIACRNSLQNTWGLKLQELKRNYPTK